MPQSSAGDKKICFGKREFALLIVSSTIGFLVAIVSAEVYFWNKNESLWVGPGTVFDDELGWANLKNGSSAHKGITYTTNSLGFRSTEIDTSREHMLILGDSVAYGLNVSDHETVSHYLGQNIPGLQILNLGVPGYSIDQYYLALKRHIYRTRPKYIIVIIFPTNDFKETTADHMFGVSKPFFLLDKGVLVNTRPIISKFTCQNLTSKSWLAGKLFDRNKLRDRLCGERKWRGDDQTVKNFKALFEAIVHLAFAHQSALLFVISPSLQAVKADLLKDLTLPADNREVFLLQKLYNEDYLVFYQKTLKFLNDIHLKPLDFASELLLASKQTDPEEFYAFVEKRDQFHLSAKGNKLLADAIFRELKNLHKTSDNPQ